MATNFMPFLNENVELTPSGTSSNTSKQVLLFGQRITEGVLTPALNGNTQPNYYIPWVLPSFKTGNEALAYLNTYGIRSQIGYNFTLVLPQPTAINSVLGNTVLTWSTVPYGFTQLTDFNLSGTLTQGILSGPATIATIISGVASLTIQGIVAFSTSGGNMTLTGVNNVQYPDPNETDPIALMVWDFYQTALSAASSANGVPNAILSITSDRETSITAVATPIVLGAPDAIDIETEETTVTYPENTVGLGYLPTTAYGTTTVSQSVALPTTSTNAVYYADGVYLRGSNATGGIQYSLNGGTWINTNITTGNYFGFYNNGSVFVACSGVGLYYSADGITWTVTNKSTGAFKNVYFANGVWLAISTVGLWYTADVTASAGWTACTGATTGVFNQIAFGNAVWLATSTAGVFTSADGITFAAISGTATNSYNGLAFINSLFQVGSTSADGIFYTTDGATLTASNITSGGYSAFASLNGTLIAVGTSGIYSSGNGLTWTVTNVNSGTFTSVIESDGTLVATSSVGVYYSTNGTAWTITSITTGSYLSVFASPTLFIVGGVPGIKISTDGITFQTNNVASGTYGGYSIQNGNVVISITDVIGTFIVSDSISVVLDNTINAYSFLDGVDIHNSVLQFPINNATNISTTHADYYNGNTLINEPAEANNGHYFTYAIAGNITSLPNQVNNLPIANDQTKILVTYPYVQKFGNIPYDNTNGNVASGRVASCVAYMLANGDAPYPPLMLSRINHLPVSSVASTTSYSIAQGSTGNAAVTRGWLPLAPNSNNVVQFLQSNTTLTTLPGTNVPDIEFRYTHIWDCVRDLKRNIAQYFQVIRVLPDNAGSALISPSFLTTFKNGIVSILYAAQTAGVVQNVALYADLVTVTQDPDNPNQVDAYVPSQIIPQLNGANILINVFSSLYQFNAA